MKRKEIKLLVENWRKFINEEVIQPIALSKDMHAQLSDTDVEGLKNHNYPAYLIVLPLPPDENFPEFNELIHDTNHKSKENIYDKSESNYNLIKNNLMKFYDKVFETSEFADAFKEFGESGHTDYHKGLYKDDKFLNMPEFSNSKDEMLSSIEDKFEESKVYMTKKGLKAPVIIYFVKMMSYDQAQESAGLFGIQKMKSHIKDSFVSWLFRHDFIHGVDKVLEKYCNVNIDDKIDEFSIRFFSMPGLKQSKHDIDNHPSVVGYLYGLTREEKKEILDKRFFNPFKAPFELNNTSLENLTLDFCLTYPIMGYNKYFMKEILEYFIVEDEEGTLKFEYETIPGYTDEQLEEKFSQTYSWRDIKDSSDNQINEIKDYMINSVIKETERIEDLVKSNFENILGDKIITLTVFT